MKSKSIILLLLALAAANVAVSLFNPDKALSITLVSKDYILEMLSILPPILILIGLFDVWVPRSFIEKAMGKASRLKGILFSILVGTAAMGPVYVAFPLGRSFLKKGASLFNVSIFLCVWASIKIPMILFEIKFLGADFAGLRLALTIPSIIAISWILSFILKGDGIYETA
jgi:uncharacterized membrane protein YraQ (UPF0718 family)